MAPIIKTTLTMKLLLLIFVILISINKTFSQKQRKAYGVVEIKFEIGAHRRVIKVDVEGDSSRADTALTESIKRRLNKPSSVDRGAKRGTYIVRVSYILDKDGNISNVECIQDPGYGMCAISVRAVKVSAIWVVPERGGPVRPMKSTYIPDSGRSDE